MSARRLGDVSVVEHWIFFDKNTKTGIVFGVEILKIVYFCGFCLWLKKSIPKREKMKKMTGGELQKEKNATFCCICQYFFVSLRPIAKMYINILSSLRVIKE